MTYTGCDDLVLAVAVSRDGEEVKSTIAGGCSRNPALASFLKRLALPPSLPWLRHCDEPFATL